MYYTWFVLVLSSTTLPSSLTSITNIPMRYFLPLAYNKSEPRKMMIMMVYCRKLYNIYLGWIHNTKIVRCIKTWDLIHIHSEYTLIVWPTSTITYFRTYNIFRNSQSYFTFWFYGYQRWHNLNLVKTTERNFMVGFGYSLSLMHFVFSARAHSWYYDL